MVAPTTSSTGWNDRNDDQRSDSSRNTSHMGSHAGATSSGDSSWQALSASRHSFPAHEVDQRGTISISSLVGPASSSVSPTDQKQSRELPLPLTPLALPSHSPVTGSMPSSRSEWFSCPSIAHNLNIHQGAAPRREVKLRLVMIQQPQHALAAGSGVMAHKYGRANPVDPPPICQLLTQDSADNIYLQHPEVSLRAHLVQADWPCAEVMPGTNREAQLINGIHESPFVAPVTSSQLQSLFLFTELGVRCPGRYRLRFDLYDRVDSRFQKLASIYTDTFEVHDTRRNFPGLQRSSDLMRAIVARGLKVRITDSQPSRSVKRRKMTEGGLVVVGELPSAQQSSRAAVPDYAPRQSPPPPPREEASTMSAWRTLPHPTSLSLPFPSTLAYQAPPASLGQTSWALPNLANARSSAQHSAPRVPEPSEGATATAWGGSDRSGYADRSTWQPQPLASPYGQAGHQHHGLPGLGGAPRYECHSSAWHGEGSRQTQGPSSFPRRSSIQGSNPGQQYHQHHSDASRSQPPTDEQLRSTKLPPITSWNAQPGASTYHAPPQTLQSWQSQPLPSPPSATASQGSVDPFIPPNQQHQQHRGG